MENRKRKMIHYFLFLIFASCFFIVFRSYFVAYFIKPIALVCWVIWRIISSIDQNVYWALLVGVCAIFVCFQLLPAKEITPRSLYIEKQGSPNRVEHWQKIITDTGGGKGKADQLRESLEELLGKMNVQYQRPSQADFDDLPAERSVSIPPAVQRYLYEYEQEKEPFPGKIMAIAPEWFQMRRNKMGKRDISTVEEMISWMENELEIENGK